MYLEAKSKVKPVSLTLIPENITKYDENIILY